MISYGQIYGTDTYEILYSTFGGGPRRIAICADKRDAEQIVLALQCWEGKLENVMPAETANKEGE